MAHDKPTTTATPPAEPPTAVFVQQIHDEMRSSFMDYAMSVIIARASRRSRWVKAGASADFVRDARRQHRLEPPLRQMRPRRR